MLGYTINVRHLSPPQRANDNYSVIVTRECNDKHGEGLFLTDDLRERSPSLADATLGNNLKKMSPCLEFFPFPQKGLWG